eukprot:4903327-Pyramimonas_sp.AAC.1
MAGEGGMSGARRAGARALVDQRRRPKAAPRTAAAEPRPGGRKCATCSHRDNGQGPVAKAAGKARFVWRGKPPCNKSGASPRCSWLLLGPLNSKRFA